MKKFLKNNWLYLIAAFFILLLFSIRFINVNLLPVFADEAIYVRWSQVMRAEETLRFLPLSDGKQPLFMWITILFFKLFEDPLLAGRFVSIFAGLGTLLGVATASYILFKNKIVTLVASLFYALSPFTFFFDRMALADSLLSMFGIWTFIFGYLSIKKSRLDLAMIAGFTLGGAWLTKSPALFFALMLPFFWLFAPWKKGLKKNLRVFLKSLSLSLISIAIGFGFYNILRLGPNFHMIAIRNMDYVYPLGHLFERPFDPLKVFMVASFKWIWVMGPLSLLVLSLISYFANIKNYGKQILVLTIWFLGPIIVQSEFAKTLTARYFLFTIPYLILLAASVFTTKNKLVRNISTAFVALFIIQSSIFNYHLISNPEKAPLPRVERSGYLEEWTAGHGIKETADYLIREQEANPQEKIVIGTEGYFGTLPDGLQMYLNDYPQITAIGVGLTFDELPTPLYESKKFGNKTYLLVNDSRYYYDPEKKGLKLVKEFPKAEKPTGVRDSLLLLEVTDEAVFQKDISGKN